MSPELEYLVNSGAWSLGGLVVGFFLGRLERDIRTIKGAVERREERGDRDDHA
jgi:hypothetical protein